MAPGASAAAHPEVGWQAGWHASLAACGVLAGAAFGPATLQWQRSQRLQALLAAARSSRLYAERLADASGMLERVRPVRKTELMGRFDDWVTDPSLRLADLRRFVADPANIGCRFAGRYMVWESSGSSGEPGLFVQDEAAMGVYDALEALRRPPSWRRWLDPLYAAERIAFVGAIDGHFASIVSFERVRRQVPGMAERMRAFSFLQPMEVLVRRLMQWRPTVLATYPSTALALAGEAAAGRLRLSLNELWTGGEALGRGARTEIARCLACPVHQSYGASEFLALAAECGHGRLHLNSDWAILECVDENHRALPPGEVGATTLLTNLANHVQPIIRYDLSDRVRIGTAPCACGSVLPTIEVEGRVDEAFSLATASGRDVRLLPLALTTVLEDDGHVFDFQLARCGPRTLQLTLPASAPAPAAGRARSSLARYLCSQGLEGIGIRVRRGVPDAHGRSGKRPRIMAHANQGGGGSDRRGGRG